jgi:imidazoleglycerol-phosphate dehydratase/histidinol-phosphatase
MKQKIIFIDRDGTLLEEPEDKQIDSLNKFKLLENVIISLIKLKNAGYRFVMITNQDGLGSNNYSLDNFNLIQNLLLNILESQGIYFDKILICAHFESDNCFCRKPKVGLLVEYLVSQKIDLADSYVIGDRDSDLELSKNLNIKGLKLNDKIKWNDISDLILLRQREANIYRKTNETEISIYLNLDKKNNSNINTGIGFFDHMLDQIAKHSEIQLNINVKGDLFIDDHHTIEDTALALGEALKIALGDKRGIQRFSFLMPMDESLSKIALDLSGRSFFKFKAEFKREKISNFSTELVSHFYFSLMQTLKATIHIEANGENDHHKIESIFKGFGKVLGQAIKVSGNEIPSTKGIL